MSEKGRRAFFYGMGAIYSIYLAYRMYTEQVATGGAESGLLIAAMLFFVIAGAVLLFFAIKLAKEDKNEEKKNDTDESETN